MKNETYLSQSAIRVLFAKLLIVLFIFILISNGCKKEDQKNLTTQLTGTYKGIHMFRAGFGNYYSYVATVTITAVSNNQVSVKEDIDSKVNDAPPFSSLQYTANVYDDGVSFTATLPGLISVSGYFNNNKLTIAFDPSGDQFLEL